MGYTIRRWMTCTDQLFDESMRADTAEEAIQCCRKLAGIYHSVVNANFIERVNGLEFGKTARIKDKALKLTILVRRTKY